MSSVHDTLMAVAFSGKKSGGVSLPRKAINFLDFEGRIIHAFTREEVQSLSELPALPMVEDKIATGWNKTLAEVKVDALAGKDATIEVISEEKDVLFIDYDGTLLNGYTAEEFAELTEMPESPTYIGKVSQGWNWSLSDVKAEVSNGAKLVIGQTYLPSDGMTHIYFSVPEDMLTVTLRFAVKGTISVIWGDGSPDETVTGTSTSTVISTPHTYDTHGKKHIAFGGEGTVVITGGKPLDSVAPASANGSIFQDAIHRNYITDIEIGSNCTLSGSFTGMHSLKTVTIPNGVTSVTSFEDCNNLQAVVFPNGCTQIGPHALYDCSTIKYLSLPKTITFIGEYAFKGLNKLKTAYIPSGVSTWNGYAFSGCYELEYAYIADGVPYIGERAFSSCHKLKKVRIPSSLERVGLSAFVYCYDISEIILPDRVTTINQGAFDYCRSLTNVSLGKITLLDQQALRYCTSLTKLTVPSTVTEIRQPIAGCYYIKKLRFEPETPPTIGSSYRGSLSVLPTDCIIEVKYSEDHHILEAYQSAQYYPDPGTYTYVEYTDGE